MNKEQEEIVIYSDSIGTHWNFKKDGYLVYYDKQTAERNGIMSERDCWGWMVANQLAKKDGMIAKIENHSYSGSFVTGSDFPSGASDQRILAMRNPHYRIAYILIYMGFNDFGYKVPVWPFDAPGQEVFYSSYCYMLRKMKEQFPEAQILPATLLMTESDIHPQWKFPEEDRFNKYNKAIRHAAAACGCTLVDLAETGVRLSTMVRDHSHPDVVGQYQLGECWIRQLKSAHVL